MTIPRPEIPYHLIPLTEGTPLSLEKVKAAWPGLVFCDKICLLSVLLGEPDAKTNGGVLKWKRHRNFLRTIAFADENDYIRYFAALSVSSEDKDEGSVSVYQQVIKDPSSLVLSSQDHWSLSAFMLPSKSRQGIELFWRVAAPRRLAVAAELLGSDLSTCLKFAVDDLLPKGTVTLGELEDVVHEFIGSPSSNRKKDVSDLWQIAPYLPLSLSLVLVDSLPPVLRVEVPQDVLNRFNDDHIQVLLAREDIQLFELRRKVFQSASKSGLMHAAVSNARFAILDSDISELFADPVGTRDRAVALTQSARGATLAQKQALRWFIEQHNLDPAWVQYQAERHLTARSQTLSGKSLEDEVLQMRLFEFARVLNVIAEEDLAAVRDRYSGDLDYLRKQIKGYSKLVVAGNPWATYLNLRQSIPDVNSLRRVLPSADDERYLDRQQLPPDLRS